ncbi:hypothetical protein MOQ72_21345 [Saccharopolyspora sp. K220]|uniref:hypothetical protein n=1 Tax=Saccharopolyspora soli TaxID=2926618 RepID=UPI001F5AE614|nr:hypothetical protein [Saccharopolyspora soli]MCI2419997.1 hypothetical protein [Saccharopolyspora soli]
MSGNGRHNDHYHSPPGTVRTRRRVLVIVDNVTAMTRLLDVVDLFEGDFRVELDFVWNRADPHPNGLAELFAAKGVFPLRPDSGREYHLAITAGHSGLLGVDTPILSLPHGIRYTKVIPEARKPGSPEARKPGSPEARKPGAFGLSPDLVLHEGRPIPSTIALSHHEQLERLRASTPEAADVAVITGDPCYDRLRASSTWRLRYRRSLGADDDQTVLAVSSTWRPDSLFGEVSELFEQLLAELPVDDFRVVAILHPHIWYEHGPDQVHRWLAPQQRSGLIVVPPEHGWRAALVAADQLIGDHGSVTAYGAAIGLPTSLAVFPESEVAPGSAVALLGSLAPRLDLTQPLLPQLRKTAAEHTPAKSAAVHEMITSHPDEAAERLRGLCYSMLDLDEPRTEPSAPPDTTAGLPTAGWTWRPTAMHAIGKVHSGQSITLDRYPAEMLRPERIPPGSHLVVAADHPGRRMLAVADVVVLTEAEQWGQHSETWLQDALSTRRGLQLAAAVQGDSCVIRTREGTQVRLTGRDDPMLYASAVFEWLATGRELADLSPELTVNGRPVAVS